LSVPEFVFSENGPGKVEILRYSFDYVQKGYEHEASGTSFKGEMDNKYVIEREADEGTGSIP
jgi:hypothetical protein